MDAYEEMERAGFEHVGNVGVDTGRMLIGDPVKAPSSRREWESLAHVDLGEWHEGVAETSLGHLVRTGHGDGSYPLFVRRMPDGTIAEIRVVFIAAPVALTDDEKHRIVSENLRRKCATDGANHKGE